MKDHEASCDSLKSLLQESVYDEKSNPDGWLMEHPEIYQSFVKFDRRALITKLQESTVHWEDRIVKVKESIEQWQN